VFVEVAKLLSNKHDDIFFHVVGSFDRSDIDVGDIGARIKFYGTKPTGYFPAFYSGMDMILSPNVPFVLSPGAFDGFPTGGCIEAGLSGVAVFCSDPLDQNIEFEDGEELVIISRDPEAISEKITRYRARHDELNELARKGQKAFERVFGEEAQLGPRLRLLSDLMGKGSPDPESGSREPGNRTNL
jgi:glycosyltransferase involved in cell wall biosynthesis